MGGLKGLACDFEVLLFGSQGLHGVDRCGAAGWEQAGCGSDGY